MSNERQRQASTPVVVAKDNLRQTEIKDYPLQNRRNKIMSICLKRLTHTTQRTGRGRPCHLNSKHWILSQWMDENMKQNTMGDDWWKWRLCYKIKLSTGVKTFTRYNDRSRLAAKKTNKKPKKQTQRHSNWGIFRFWTFLCSAVIEINIY